jgi:hypothetical protein
MLSNPARSRKLPRPKPPAGSLQLQCFLHGIVSSNSCAAAGSSNVKTLPPPGLSA